ncbi:MAG: SO_0444 family Cu/Zn efflux transporter [Pseudomonadota bacterium]
MIQGIAAESLNLLYKMSPYLLFGFFFAGVLHAFISLDWIARHLGKSSVGSVIKAVILGIPLPLCSCGVIPAAIMLNKKGASRGAVTSFLIATPITGIDSILATYSLMGFFFALFRVISSAVTAIIAGLLGNLFLRGLPPAVDLESLEKHHCHEPGMEASCECECHSITIWDKARELFRYAFVELLGDIWRWLVIGLLIAGLIAYFVPSAFVERYLGSHILSMLVMLIVGIPMYVCSTGSLPIAAALMIKGMSPGAAMVFLLAGPATNAVTITVVSKELGKAATIIYVLTIAVMSILSGLVLNEIWYGYGMSMRALSGGMAMIPHWVEVASSIILVLLIIHVVIRNLIGAKHKH